MNSMTKAANAAIEYATDVVGMENPLVQGLVRMNYEDWDVLVTDPGIGSMSVWVRTDDDLPFASAMDVEGPDRWLETASNLDLGDG